ncbi:MAG TPA: cupredoxin domain-containing protein [Candidatus Acidoferrales bacterium]|jgi:cytochrome c oxidase subunit 2|nr:cupredoxin domain-containing protein [Candidatus Acidoferrales bacterium]
MKNWRWLVLFLVLVAAGSFAARFRVGAAENPRLVTITAKRFEFSPSQITLKKGETVKLVLKSEDVTHGFLMKALAIDTDIPAGETAEVTFTPQTAGRFTTICDHFCGAGHGNMKMTIVVE